MMKTMMTMMMTMIAPVPGHKYIVRWEPSGISSVQAFVDLEYSVIHLHLYLYLYLHLYLSRRFKKFHIVTPAWCLCTYIWIVFVFYFDSLYNTCCVTSMGVGMSPSQSDVAPTQRGPGELAWKHGSNILIFWRRKKRLKGTKNYPVKGLYNLLYPSSDSNQLKDGVETCIALKRGM